MPEPLRIALLVLALAAIGARAQDGGGRFEVTERFVEISDGTTMFHLVREHYPLRWNNWLEVAHDLAAANPDAFRNGDPGALIVGQRVYLIDYGEGIAGDDGGASAPAAAATAADDDTAADTAAGDGTAVAPEPVATDRPAAADPALPIGQITRLRGNPTATDADNRSRRLGRGEDVFRGDTLVTGADAQVSLLMADGVLMHLRTGARLVFEHYGPDDRVLTLPRGALRVVAGSADDDAPGVTINTAVATIHAGGADVALRICSDGACRVDEASIPLADGLYCAVAGGRARLSNNTGETAVERGNAVRVRSADSPPKPVPEALGAVYTPLEMSELDLRTDEPLGFWAWFRQRFF